MAKKKKEEENIEPKKKTTLKTVDIEIEKYSIGELIEKHRMKPLQAASFLNHYGLTEDFKKEFETGKIINKFSEGEFNDMYERYNKREI